MASKDKDKGRNVATSEWKTKGHPWVDRGLQVAGPWAVPTSRNSAAIANLTGSVIGFGPVDESQRRPALARMIYEAPAQPPTLRSMPQNVVLAVDLTGTEIQDLQKQCVANDTAMEEGATTIRQTLRLPFSFPIPSGILIQNAQKRYQARLDQYLQESILPPLIALAALEEATAKMVKQRIAQEDAEQAAQSNSSNNSSRLSSPHPPLYYFKPPNQYLTPPSAATPTSYSSLDSNDSRGDPTKEHLSSTPAAWLSRVKLGCQQAWNEHVLQQQHEQQLLQLCSHVDTTELELSTGRRSSSRIARITTEQWEQIKPRTTRSAKQQQGSIMNVEVYLKGNRVARFLQKLWEEQQQKNRSETKLDVEQQGDEENEEEEEEENEDDLDLFNPYLQPAYGDVLKFLRKIRLEDIQNSIPHWCQETHTRTSHKVLRQQLDEEEEMENVLEVEGLPLDNMVLGIEEEKVDKGEAKQEEEGGEGEAKPEEHDTVEVVILEVKPTGTEDNIAPPNLLGADDTQADAGSTVVATKERKVEIPPESALSNDCKHAELDKKEPGEGGSAFAASSSEENLKADSTQTPNAGGGKDDLDGKTEPENGTNAGPVLSSEESNGLKAEVNSVQEASDVHDGDSHVKKEIYPDSAIKVECSPVELKIVKKECESPKNSPEKDQKGEDLKGGQFGSKQSQSETATSKENCEHEEVEGENNHHPSVSLILQWEIPDSIEKAPSKAQVHKYLQSQDTSSFGKLTFSLKQKDKEIKRLRRQLEGEILDEGMLRRQQEEQIRRKEAERAFQIKKNWDKWRFEGIHGGHTIWPRWQDAVSKWQGERNAKEAAEASNTGQTATLTVPPTDQEEGDRAKALELAQKDIDAETAEGTGTAASRRTRRKATSSAGTVFYGQSSQLTARQLVELILRLCSEKSTAPTILHLQSIVAEDGTQDPVRRLRAALGKLVWRRNQLARLTPSTDWTDKHLATILRKRPLFIVAAAPTDEVSQSGAEPDQGSSENRNNVEMNHDGSEATEQAASEHNEKGEALLQYLRRLHQTELQLRKVVLEHLTEIPIPIVATAADEKEGSNEGYDTTDFQDHSDLNWQTQGHELIGRHIFRPRQTTNTNDLSQCEWFTIKSYVASVPVEGVAEEPSKLSGSNMKDSPLVDRRMRFRAAPFVEEGTEPVEFDDEEYMVLTEAQAMAGIHAANLEQLNIDREEEEEKVSMVDHPFAGSGLSAKITLYPDSKSKQQGVANPIQCTVVGHDSVLGDTAVETVHRILVLPFTSEKGPSPSAVWAALDVSDETEIRCKLDDNPMNYRIQLSDFHPESLAFAECRKIVEFLENHQKASPFLEPVDPVALNIPHYTKIITNPMDISTLSEKLENGQYSNVPPKQAAGRSPVARMLNGPFREDVELIFDNAMLFNPPKDWIYQDASTLKKAVLRKIDSISQSADSKFRRSGNKTKESIYLDEDSDVDMYEYESDKDDDDDYRGSRNKRKRSKGPVRPTADDNCTRAMEHPIRLQKTLSEAVGLRGPFANFRVENDSSIFAHPPHWSCRRKKPSTDTTDGTIEQNDDSNTKPRATDKHEEEMEQLVELQRTLEETETAGLRRSTRAVAHDEGGFRRGKKSSKKSDIEYYMLNEFEQKHFQSSEELTRLPPPSTRQDVEYICERLHESLYSNLYHDLWESLEQGNLDGEVENGDTEKESSKNELPIGSFANGSFPPFLGRMVPVSLAKYGKFAWEIRAPFQIPALRWVIRGLIQSGHVGEMEPLDQEFLSSGVIMANHVYYTDSTLQPFEVLDSKELARRRRANNEDAQSSEDEVELSEYEKLRAERVARNTERLKALGLA